MYLSEIDVERIREKALQKWRMNGRAVARSKAARVTPAALEQRIYELGRQWEAEAVASAEAYAARHRARKPAGQATTPDGAAIDPEARQA